MGADLLAPQVPQLAYPLGEHSVPVVEVDAEGLVLRAPVADPEAGLDPAIADHIDQRHLLGDLDSGMQRQQADSGADPDASGAGGHSRRQGPTLR